MTNMLNFDAIIIIFHIMLECLHAARDNSVVENEIIHNYVHAYGL